MKQVVYKIVSLLWAILLFVFFQASYFFISGETILGYTYDGGQRTAVLLINLLIFFSFYVFLFLSAKLRKENFTEIVPPLILDLSLMALIFYNPVSPVSQLLIVPSIIIICLSSLYTVERLNNGERGLVFSNVASVFAAFLCFLDAYLFFYILDMPYWIMILVSVLATSLLMIGEFGRLRVLMIQRVAVSFLYSIIMVELFLFSFFWPINSIMIKTLLLTAVYYLYWGIIIKYFRNTIIKNEVIIYSMVFILIVFGTISTLLFTGK